MWIILRDGFEHQRRTTIAFGHDDRVVDENRGKRQSKRSGQSLRIGVRRIDQHQVKLPRAGGAPKKLDRIAADGADARCPGTAGDDVEVCSQHRSHARIALHEGDVRGAARKRFDAHCARSGEKIEHAKPVDVAEDREQRLAHLVAGRSRDPAFRTDQSATFEFSGDDSHPAQPVTWAQMVKPNVVPTMVMNTRTRHKVTGRRAVTLLAAFLLSIAATGCGDEPTTGAPTGATAGATAGATTGAATDATGVTTTHMPTNPIDKGLHGNIPAKRAVVLIARTDDEYAKLENKVRGPGSEDSWRTVGFKSRMVVAVQTRPGGGGESVTINGVEENNGVVSVHATHTVPGKNCAVAAVITHPFAVADVPRLSGRPTLVLKTATRDC